MVGGSKIRVLMEVAMPQPGTGHPETRPPPLEDKVRDALELIQSGYRSSTEWKMINKLYKHLQGLPRSPRVDTLMRMIEPVLSRYGYHKVAAE
jgi:hypothetical protein